MNSADQLCNFEAAAQISQPKPDGESKKQVRRRRHSRRRLYKEMPLDMAEARREIVTALKLHRASTKEAREQQQKQDQQINQSIPIFPQLGPCFEGDGRRKSRRNTRTYPDCSFYLENGSGFVAPPSVAQNLITEIPTQSFDDDFKTSSYCPLSFWPPSSYIYPTVSCSATHQEVPKSISLSEEEGNLMASDVFWFNNDQKDMQEGAVEEARARAMAEVRPMTMDVKALESDGHHSCENPMEFSDWPSINDDFLQQHSNYHCVEEDYLQDPDLSWYQFNLS
ncbi:uncharacterized protein LOC120085720 [Benincasa hispida]|uniref:uncharacterized protein LOC120085720 n=1 Tax=Benincasa hispida TaxID=102211 RepID=UPI001902BD03|nr:uncharacterized protein LOC120085720 [Benincasa hispida]